MFRIFQTCRGISRVRLTRFEQRKTKDESSDVLRETLLPRCGNPPPHRKAAAAAAAAAAILCQYIREQKSIYIKKEIPKEERIWTTILGCQKSKGHSFETRISKCVTKKVRHHDQDEREADGAMHWDGVFSVWKGKFRNQLEKEFTDEDWLHCFVLEASRQGLKST